MPIKIGARAPTLSELEELSALSVDKIGDFFVQDKDCYEICQRILAGPQSASDYINLCEHKRVVEGILYRSVIDEPRTSKVRQAILKILGIEEKREKIEDNSFPLHEAIQKGDTEALEALLNSGKCDVNAIDDEGNTPLHLIAQAQNDQYVKQNPRLLTLLLEHKANPNIFSKQNTIPIVDAHLKGNKQTLEILLKYGFNMDDPTVRACFNNNRDAYKILEDYIGNLPFLSDASKEIKSAFLDFCLRKKLELWSIDNEEALVHFLATQPLFMRTYPNLVSKLLEEFFSPLTYMENKEQRFREFLENLDEPSRLIVLEKAIEYGHVPYVRDIVDMGIDLTACYANNPELTPLHHAIKLGNPAITTIFLQNGLHINTLNKKNQTPLDLLIQPTGGFGIKSLSKEGKILFFLLDRGAKITEAGALVSPLNALLKTLSQPTSLSNNELHPLVYALIARGADPSPYGKELLFKSLVNNHFGLALLCLDKLPQLRLEESDWVLSMRCYEPYWLIHVAEKMFARGVGINDDLGKGKTLFDIAYQANNRSFAGYLATKGAKLSTEAQKDAAFMHYVNEIQKSTSKPAEQRLRHLLTARNLGHLVGDAFLRKMVDEAGKKMEGSQTVDGIALTFCLLDYILESRSDTFTERERQKIGKLSRELKESYEFEWRLNDLIGKENRDVNGLALRDLANNLQRRIVNADIRQEIPVSLGWKTRKSGHAIMASFSRLENGKIQMRVTNTGAAAANAQFNRVQLYVALEEVFEFTEQEMIENQYLFKLLEPIAMGHIPHHIYGEDELKFILEQIRETMGKPIISKRNRRAQFAGTCTMRCQLANLQVVLGDEVYKKLSLPMKIDVSEFAVEQNQLYLSQEKQLRKLLHLITSNLARRIPTEEAEKGMEQVERLANVKRTLSLVSNEKRATPVAVDTPLHMEVALPPFPLKTETSQVQRPSEVRESKDSSFSLFPKRGFDQIKSPKDLLEVLKEQRAFVEKVDPFISSPIASQLIIDVSLEMMRAYHKESTPFSPVFESLRKDRVACENFIKELALLTEELANQDPRPPSIYREIAGQAALCAAWIASSLIEDALETPKGKKLRVDEFALDAKIMEHIVALPSLLEEYPPYLLTDPLICQQAVEIYEFMKEKSGECFFDWEKHLEREGKWLELYIDNQQDVVKCPLGSPYEHYTLSIEGTAEYNFCDAHVKKLISEGRWDTKTAKSDYESQEQILGTDKKIEDKLDSFYAHWFYMSGQLPVHFYNLRDIATNSLQLKANYARHRNKEDPIIKLPRMNARHPTIRLRFKDRITDRTEIPAKIAYAVEKGSEGWLREKYFQPDIVNKRKFLPQNSQDMSPNMYIDASMEKKDEWPLYMTLVNGINSLWVTTLRPERRRLFALREPFKSNRPKVVGEAEYWNSRPPQNSTLVLSQLVDYFSENPHELEEQPQRILMLYTLSNPGSLKKALEESTEFAHELQEFFVKNINSYKDRFILAFDLTKTRDTLSFLYQCYIFMLTTMDPETRLGKSTVAETLKGVRADMKALWQNKIWAKDPQATMHLCLNLVASYQNRAFWHESDAADLLEARFLYKKLSNHLPDQGSVLPNVSPQYVLNTWSSFVTRLNELRSQLSDRVLTELAAKHGVTLPSDSQWDRSDYPNVSVSLKGGDTVMLALATGAIYVGGREVSPMPTFISEDSAYKRLFGFRTFPCKENNGAYEGFCDGVFYRFEYNSQEGKESVKRICSLREGIWHELIQPTSPSYPSLPLIMSEFLLSNYLPIKGMEHNYCHVWKKLDKESPGYLLIGRYQRQQVKINENGYYQFNEKWYERCLDDTLKGFSTISAFDPRATVWQEVSDKPEKTIIIKTPTYQDESGKRVALELARDEKTGKARWVLQSAPHLFLSADQHLEGFGETKRYLILETENKERFLLLPRLDKDGQSQEINLSSPVVLIRLQDGKPKTQDPEKLALLAYHKLLSANDPADYSEVMHYLEKAKKFGRYTAEELRLFGWIFNAYKSTKDRTILGDAIRLYTMWLVEDNLRRNPGLEKGKSPQDKVPHFNANAETWQEYWMGEAAVSSKMRLAKRYLTHHHRLPKDLRLENLIDAQEFLNFNLEKYATPAGSASKKLSIPGLSQNNFKTFHKYFKTLLEKRDGKGFDTRLLIGKQLEECFGSLYLMAQSSDPRDRQRVRQIVKDSAIDEFPGKYVSNVLSRMLLGALCDSYDAPKGSELSKTAQTIKKRLATLAVNDEVQMRNAPIENPPLWDLLNTYYALTKLKISDNSFDLVAPAELFKIEEVVLADEPKKPQFSFEGALNQPPILTDLFKTCLHQTDEKAITGEFVPYEFETDNPKLKESLKAFNEDCRLGHEQLAQVPLYKLNAGLTEADLLSRRTAIQEALREERDKLQLKETEILGFAQKLREARNDPAELLAAKKAEVSGAAKPLAIHEYIGMYVHADPQIYELYTGITNKEEQLKLHHMIGEYLVHSTATQAIERTDELLKRLEEAVDKKEKSEARDQENIQEEILDIIQSLAEETGFVWQVDPKNDIPALLVFQERMGVALKSKQLAAVREMMKLHPNDPTRYLDVMIQLIQGGGKTFFIAPTIALIKADGYHASFLVSPTSQIATSLPNMRTISSHAYGQHERTLVFDDSPQYSTPQYLTWMLGYIRQTIHNRGYFNVTKETLRALLCKETKERISQANPESYQVLKKIRKLIKERGAFTFDEAHKAFSPWTLLNMPYGKPYAPDPKEVELMSGLFLNVLLAEKDGQPVLNVLHSADQDPKQLKAIASEAAKTLLKDKEWQRKLELLDKGGNLIQTRADELENFVFGKTANIPKFLDEIKENRGEETCAADLAVLLMKSVHGNWLSDRLLTRIFVNHGKKEVSGQPTVSRPFKANMKPEVESDFSDIYVMVYNTLIAYAAEKLTLNQTKALIGAWRRGAMEEYKRERAQNPEYSLADTQHVKQFYDATHLDLYRLDDSNEGDLLQIQLKLQNRDQKTLKLLFDYVAQEELSKVQLYPTEISSNGQDTAAMARSQNSFSGSADNPYMLPVGTSFTPDTGTNGQTIALIRSKKTELWATEKDYDSLFTHVIDVHPNKERIRAIIDVGSHFVGMTNEDVAEMICKRNKNPQITKVLYFATDSNELYAMDVADPAVRVKISGTSEKVICQETGVGPEKRFTFYDNFNIEGTDIVQMLNALAVVTLNADNTTTEQVQGEQRLRNLKRRQAVICTAHIESFKRIGETLNDPILANATVTAGKTNVPIEKVQLNGHLQLEKKKPEEVLLLALQKVQTEVKVFVQSELDKLEGMEEKKLSKSTEYLFMRTVKRNLYREFAHKPETMDSKTFLNNFLNDLVDPLEVLQDWFSLEELMALKKRIKKNILEPIYDKIPANVEVQSNHTSLLAPNLNQTSTQTQFRQQTGVQQQQQQQMQLQQQQQQFQYTQQSSKGKVAFTYPVDMEKFLKLESIQAIDKEFDRSVYPQTSGNLFLLQDVVKKEEPGLLDDLTLDPNIYVDANFATVFPNKTSLLDGNRKSIEQIALVLDTDQEGKKSWKAIILNQTTARDLQEHLSQDKPIQPAGRKVWLVRATGKFAPYKSTQCPTEKAIFDDPVVQRLMTQILFISGNVSRLNRKPWLDILDGWLPQEAKARARCKQNYEKVVRYGNITAYKGSALEKIFNKYL